MGGGEAVHGGAKGVDFDFFVRPFVGKDSLNFLDEAVTALNDFRGRRNGLDEKMKKQKRLLMFSKGIRDHLRKKSEV
jgi:hypothetical protein